MNFEESNAFVEQMEKNNKKKKTVITVMIICVILIAVLLGMIGYLKYQDSLELKMYVDGKQVRMSSTLLIESETEKYMNVRELASMLGYSYQNGEYKNYTEDANSCYLKNAYEIVSMSADKDTLTKYILNSNESARNSGNLIEVDPTTGQQFLNMYVHSENETSETFTITVPIQYVNNELYVAFSELPRIFNVQLDVSNPNRIRVYSLNYLVASCPQMAQSLGYSQVSNIYENLTAIVDNMLVVGDGVNYGVVSLAGGKEIISLKYDKIVYMQNTKEFFVTAEGSVGIISSDGRTIIKPTEYDSIANLDEIHKLYLVEKNGKQGVLNGQGETVVYAEYESIGVENFEEFKNEDIRNFSLLFDECIPVNANGKVGIVDIEGIERLRCVYDSLGYVANAENNRVQNNNRDDDENTNSVNNSTVIVDEHDSVLTIPESVGIKGIVVNLNGLYGIYDAESKRLLTPCVFSRIYSKTKSGVTTYYLEENGTELELESYLIANNLKSVNANMGTQNSLQNNEIIEQ